MRHNEGGDFIAERGGELVKRRGRRRRRQRVLKTTDRPNNNNERRKLLNIDTIPSRTDQTQIDGILLFPFKCILGPSHGHVMAAYRPMNDMGVCTSSQCSPIVSRRCMPSKERAIAMKRAEHLTDMEWEQGHIVIPTGCGTDQGSKWLLL